MNHLNKLENNKDVVKNQLYNLLNFLFTAIISILSIKIITEKIDPLSFGIFRYVLAVLSICTVTTITGINRTVGGYVAKGFHGTVKESTILSIKTGFLGIIILLGFGINALYLKNNTTESILFFTAALFFLPNTIFTRYQSVLAGLEKFKDIFLYNTIQKSVLFAAAVIVILLLKGGILYYGISQLILTAILLIIFYFRSIKHLTNKLVDNGFFKHSMTVSAVGIGSQIITPGIQIILNTTLGSDMLAFYVIGNRIPTQLGSIVKPIMNPISIRLAKKNKIEYNSAVLKLIPLTLGMGLFLYSLLYLGIHYFGVYIVDEAYSLSLYYSKLLGLIILLSPTSAFLVSNAIFVKNNKGFGISIYVNQMVTVVGYFLFLEKYGVYSIAITNFVALFIQILIMIFFVSNDIKYNFNNSKL